MRVIFVNPGGDAAGGAERSLALLIGGLVENGHDAAVITLRHGTAAEVFANAGAQVLANGLGEELSGSDRHASSILFAWNAARLIGDARSMARGISDAAAKYNADIVHSNGLRSHALTPSIARSRPVVWSLRERPANRAARAIITASSRSAAAIVATSQFTARSVSHCGRPVYVVANPVRCDASVDRAEARRLVGLPNNRQIAVLFAHLHPTKGHHVAIETWAKLAQPRPLLVIAGGDLYGDSSSSYRTKVRTQVAQSGLRDDVVFVGLVPDISNLLAAADLVIHPASYPEGFGRTVAEAQTAGVPVIATNLGGVAELIDDGVSGLLFEPNDANSLAALVERVLGDCELAARLTFGGKNASSRYEPALHVASVESIYRMVSGR